MTSFALKKYGIMFICIIFVVFLYTVYSNFSGTKLSEAQAINICAKILSSQIAKDFSIYRFHYNNFYSLGDSKIELYVTYNNNMKTASDCIFKRRYKNNRVRIKQAFLVDPEGKLFYFEDIYVDVK